MLDDSFDDDAPLSRLRVSYEQWGDGAPPKPLPGKHKQATAQEIDQLRRYGRARKEWMMSLQESERAQIHFWDGDASRKRKEEATKHHVEARKVANRIDQRDTSICRHWAKMGACLYGNDCRFRHPDMSMNKVIDNACNTSTVGITSMTTTKNSHQLRTRVNRTNDNRMGAFRRFLLDTYGEQRLKSGSGVVEVSAGIHGGISFELVNLNKIPCTAIEPRGPLRLGKRRRMLENGIYHRTIPLQKYNSIGLEDVVRMEGTGGGANDAQSIVGKAPRHWRLFFGNWMTASNNDDINMSLTRSVKKAAALVGSAATSNGHEEDYCACKDDNESASDNDDQEKTRSSLPNDSDMLCQPCEVGEAQSPPPAKEIGDTLTSASFIIGLHPDQPTGDIVEMALALNKPFAVVPCCVFPKIFDNRRLPCGTPVRSYEQFIAWVMSKSELIRKKDLGFGGRSLVLYYDPRWQ